MAIQRLDVSFFVKKDRLYLAIKYSCKSKNNYREHREPNIKLSLKVSSQMDNSLRFYLLQSFKIKAFPKKID